MLAPLYGILVDLVLEAVLGSFFGSVGAGPKSSQTGDVAAGSLAASSKQASLLVAPMARAVRPS